MNLVRDTQAEGHAVEETRSKGRVRPAVREKACPAAQNRDVDAVKGDNKREPVAGRVGERVHARSTEVRMNQVIRLRPKFRVKGRVIGAQQKRRAADMNGFVRKELSVQSAPGEHVHAMPLE